jgi:SAM-dependent methyltransferase
MDPLAGSPWSAPATVAGFAGSAPNAVLMSFAEHELTHCRDARALDIGCGAGRNALPLAAARWHVVGTDLSWPMLTAAANRARTDNLDQQFCGILAPMDHLPARDGSFDFVIAHGIWNLARSAAEFRRAVAEAARVAKPGAALFVFTFSRQTLPPDTAPVPGELFVFTQFSGEPQCFLTEAQLDAELGRAGFRRDDAIPLREHNLPRPGGLTPSRTTPVIFEALFRRDPGLPA